MKNVVVTNKFNNKKIFSFLKNEFPFLTQNTFYKALRKKDIRVNNVKISENVEVHEGDNITVYILDNLLFGDTPSLDIVYEDENILVVNKPKNIEVVGEDSLTSLLKKSYPTNTLIPCHRLDRNTEGLVIFAKSNAILEIMLSKFKNHEISKFYKCKVYGILEKKHQLLNDYLFKDTKKSIVYISNIPKKGYRPITTEITVLSEDKKNNYSILEVLLHTGRTHQIRAHLAYIGHPIIGDRKIWY